MYQLKWTRPKNIPSKIWLTFKAKDLNSSDLVDYTIQDLPTDRYEEALQYMAKVYLADEPLSKSRDGLTDEEYVNEHKKLWRSIMVQQMTHVCFSKSNEIIALNLNLVVTNEDDILQLTSEVKSSKFLDNIKLYNIMCERGNFNVFEKYGVDKYLTSFGVAVTKEYRGYDIGRNILEASKYASKAFGLTLRSGLFTSEYSNRIADKLGYTTDFELRWDEIQQIDSSLSFPNIESKRASLRTWVF